MEHGVLMGTNITMICSGQRATTFSLRFSLRRSCGVFKQVSLFILLCRDETNGKVSDCVCSVFASAQLCVCSDMYTGHHHFLRLSLYYPLLCSRPDQTDPLLVSSSEHFTLQSDQSSVSIVDINNSVDDESDIV